MDARPALGAAGEDLAADLYSGLGFRIEARNYRCPTGEIDLVASKGRLVVFCEVKTRRSARYGDPSEAVSAAKQRRLRRLAGTWLADRRPGPVDLRFDVVSVIVRGARADVTHIPDAF